MLTRIRLYGIICLMLLVCAPAHAKLSAKKALKEAKKVAPVVAFYNLNNGQFKNCIEAEVLRPCDTDWVTCIEDAWVVRFFLGDSCAVTPNEQLSVTLLMNNRTGEIISQFPEEPYFTETAYCVEDYDCYCEEQKQSCVNFVHALASDQPLIKCAQCACEQSQCTTKR